MVVSVIIPVYNRANTISETLQSIIKQSLEDWETIVVDDGSTDDTMSIVQAFSTNDSRFKFIRRKGVVKGGNVCRNEGLDFAKGRYVIFLDSDDIIIPDCLEKRVASMEKQSLFDFLVFPGGVFSNKKAEAEFYWNIEKKENDLSRFLNFDSPWQTTGVIWRKNYLVDNKIIWDDDLAIWQDVDFHIQALLQVPRYKILWQNTIDYLVRADSPDSLSRSNYYTDAKVNSRLRFWKKYFPLAGQGKLPAQSFRSLLLIVLKSLHVKKEKEKFQQVLKDAESEHVISEQEMRLIQGRSFMSRLGHMVMLNIPFPGQKVFDIFNTHQDHTLQCIPIVGSANNQKL